MHFTKWILFITKKTEQQNTYNLFLSLLTTNMLNIGYMYIIENFEPRTQN